MQIIKACILLITIASALSLQTSQQQNLQPALTLHQKLAQSKLGKSMLGMVQLGAKSQAGENLKESLQFALDDLRQNLTDKKEAEIDDFAEDGEAHRIEKGRLTRLINSYDLQAINFQENLEGLIAEGQSLALNLKNQKGQLKNAEAQQLNEETIIQKLADDYETQQTDYQNAIDLLGKAQDKLKEAKNTGASSFVQIHSESITVLSQQLTESMVKLKTSSSFIKPIGQFFVQLTTGEPDSSTLDRAIEALDNLKQFYINGLKQITTDYEATKLEHTNLLNTIKVQVGNLTMNVIPKTNAQLDTNDEAQQLRSQQLDTAQRESRLKTASLEAENASWEKRIQAHDELLDQYEKEWAVIENVQTILVNEAGFK